LYQGELSKIETCSEAYAPLARAGGRMSSIILTIFVVPAAYLLMYRRRAEAGAVVMPEEAHWFFGKW
jgi:hydrophobic/amphiphilic exporter-1 (mainly G- bacteria), HAE1 family